eukprot:Rmarinus@m.6433
MNLTVLFVTLFLGSALAAPVVLAPSEQANIESAYSDNFATTLAHHSTATYCLAKTYNWNDCKPCRNMPNFEITTFLENSRYDVFGYVGYDHSSRQAVVAFRGSSSLINWINNLKLSKSTAYDSVPNAKVHSGFLDSFNSVKNDFHVAINDVVRRFNPTGIVFTGHSLGGALTYIAAVDTLEVGSAKVNSIYSFGSPRVGNYEFTNFLENRVAGAWRIVNDADIVPSLPPSGLNFHHFHTEMWYKGHNYQRCDGSGEDPNCSASVPDWQHSVDDHSYFKDVYISSASC